MLPCLVGAVRLFHHSRHSDIALWFLYVDERLQPEVVMIPAPDG